MRGNASAPMTLEDVAVGDDRALSAPGKGLEMMLGVALPVFQVGLAAVAVGIAEAAVQATIGHVTHARFEDTNAASCSCRRCAREWHRCESRPMVHGRISRPCSIHSRRRDPRRSCWCSR